MSGACRVRRQTRGAKLRKQLPPRGRFGKMGRRFWIRLTKGLTHPRPGSAAVRTARDGTGRTPGSVSPQRSLPTFPHGALDNRSCTGMPKYCEHCKRSYPDTEESCPHCAAAVEVVEAAEEPGDEAMVVEAVEDDGGVVDLAGLAQPEAAEAAVVEGSGVDLGATPAAGPGGSGSDPSLAEPVSDVALAEPISEASLHLPPADTSGVSWESLKESLDSHPDEDMGPALAPSSDDVPAVPPAPEAASGVD